LKLQRIKALVGKNLKTVAREPAMLFMVVLFPVVLTLVFGVSFGAIGGNEPTSYQVAVVNMDESSPYQEWFLYFTGNLTATEILKVQTYPTNETAQNDLVQGNIQAVIIVPENFGRSCRSFWEAPNDPTRWANTTLQLYSDSGLGLATAAIPPIVQQVLAKTIGVQQATSYGPVLVSSPSLIEASRFTMFDYMAPGMFAFFAIFLIMTVSQSFTVEREKGLLRRINTTPTSPSELMTSEAISNMVLGMIQVAIVFAMSFVVGYRPAVDVASFVMASIVLAIFSLCCVGFGLIAATIAKSSGAATGIAFIFIIPQMMLGTYVSVGMSGLAQQAGKFVPSYYVTDALTSLFLRGAPPASPTILLDIFVTSVYSLAVFLLGILLFRKYGRSV
jgi:ABC-type multidrug transport system permease subunit